MLKREYMIEEIEIKSDLLCLILFNEKLNKFKYDEYEFLGNAAILKNKLEGLINDKKICKAEDLLFDEIENSEEEKFDIFRVALWYYLKLNEFDEKYLEEQNFSKREIFEGLEEIYKFVNK